jgi:hypothetical protein
MKIVKGARTPIMLKLSKVGAMAAFPRKGLPL